MHERHCRLMPDEPKKVSRLERTSTHFFRPESLPFLTALQALRANLVPYEFQ